MRLRRRFYRSVPCRFHNEWGCAADRFQISWILSAFPIVAQREEIALAHTRVILAKTEDPFHRFVGRDDETRVSRRISRREEASYRVPERTGLDPGHLSALGAFTPISLDEHSVFSQRCLHESGEMENDIGGTDCSLFLLRWRQYGLRPLEDNVAERRKKRDYDTDNDRCANDDEGRPHHFRVYGIPRLGQIARVD